MKYQIKGINFPPKPDAHQVAAIKLKEKERHGVKKAKKQSRLQNEV